MHVSGMAMMRNCSSGGIAAPPLDCSSLAWLQQVGLAAQELWSGMLACQRMATEANT